MKKFISILLVLSMLVMIPFEVSAQGTSYDTGIVDLPQKSNVTTEIRTRKQVDGLRMYVDEENPLFMIDYANGGKMNNPNDFRTSVIEIKGFETAPSVNASGSNNDKGKAEWNAETQTLTLTVISNGETRITVE